MRKLIVSTFLTLDGVMQAPGGPGEDDSDGFAYGGWSVNYWDDQLSQEMAKFMGRPYELLLGRKLFAELQLARLDQADQLLTNGLRGVRATDLPEPDWSHAVRQRVS